MAQNILTKWSLESNKIQQRSKANEMWQYRIKSISALHTICVSGDSFAGEMELFILTDRSCLLRWFRKLLSKERALCLICFLSSFYYQSFCHFWETFSRPHSAGKFTFFSILPVIFWRPLSWSRKGTLSQKNPLTPAYADTRPKIECFFRPVKTNE